MPDDSPANTAWTRAADLERLQPSKPIAVRVAGRQIALFLHGGKVLACNNRCPHEGYPLVEGELDDACMLTCNWHNWKFDLKTGTNVTGGDRLRTYPVSIRGDAIWVDVSDPPAAQRIDEALANLDAAIADFDTARIARELARLAKAGADADLALARVIVDTHDQLRDGMTHAYAAADAWFHLRDALTDDALLPSGGDSSELRARLRLTCAAEAIVYIAYDTLRESRYPYADGNAAWDADAFGAAIEQQDEDRAIALVAGALDAGLRFADLESTLASAALAHYNDFGHSLIYLVHAGRLIERLGADVERPLLRAWVRSLVGATREDLLPEFAEYATALDRWTSSAAESKAAPSELADAIEGRPLREVLEVVVSNSSAPPLRLHAALLETASRHLLRFDESRALRTDNSVADNVGWLDFTHALTFGHALRVVAERHAQLWPAGLVQLALFVGRNAPYLDPALSSRDALREWAVADERSFDQRAIARIVDHGIGLPIFPAHWLKTWSAVRETIAAGVPPATRAAMLAAVNRLLAVRFKERHPLRTATQALRFVEKED